MKLPKTVFLPANMRFEIEKIVPHIQKLPACVGLITTLQYTHQLKDIHDLLAMHKKTSVLLGQILGCNQELAARRSDFDAFFYIGSGRFHPIGVSHEFDKDIYTYNPQTDGFEMLDRKEVIAYEKKLRGLQTKFLSSDSIGVVISVKEGQMNFQSALHLKNKFPEKKFYLFACNTLDYGELENYPFIQVWVNTMCPRIGTDDYFKVPKGMVNIKDLAPFISKD